MERRRLSPRRALGYIARRREDSGDGVGLVLVERAGRLQEGVLVEATLDEQRRGFALARGGGCEQMNARQPLLARRGELLRELAERNELGMRAGGGHGSVSFAHRSHEALRGANFAGLPKGP